MLEIHLILIFMIAAALIAVNIKDLLSGVVAVGAVGIGLCMAFLVLKAPDLAMTQLVVEILSLIILVRATSRQDLPFSASGRWLFNTISTIAFIAVFLAFAYIALTKMPQFGFPKMYSAKYYIDLASSGHSACNIVSMISGKFRRFDILGEVAIIFAVVVGVLAVARGAGRIKR